MIACDKNNFLTVESTKIYFFFQNFDQKMLPTLLLESKVRKVCDEHSLHSVALSIICRKSMGNNIVLVLKDSPGNDGAPLSS